MRPTKLPPRLKRLQKLLSTNNPSLLLTSSPALLQYLFHLNYPIAPNEFFLLIGPVSLDLFVSPLSQPFSKSFSATIHRLSRPSLLKNITKERIKSNGTNLLLLDPSLSWKTFQTLASIPQITIQSNQLLTTHLTCKKDSQEINRLSTSGKLTRLALKRCLHQLKPGVTEEDFSFTIKTELARLKASPAFEPVVAFGPNTAIPHHHPGKTKYSPNDIVLIDMGANWHNYLTDTTITLLPKKPSTIMQRVYQTVKNALRLAFKLLNPQVTTHYSDIDNQVRRYFARQGFAHHFPHSTGHGLGQEIHQQPSIAAHSKAKLAPHHAVTLEPALYLPGQFGIRLEDSFLTTSTNAKNLTQTNHNLLQ